MMGDVAATLEVQGGLQYFRSSAVAASCLFTMVAAPGLRG